MSRMEALKRLRELVAKEKSLAKHEYFEGECCCVVGLVARDRGLSAENFGSDNGTEVDALTDKLLDKLEEFGLPIADLKWLQQLNDSSQIWSGEFRRERVLATLDSMIRGMAHDRRATV